MIRVCFQIRWALALATAAVALVAAVSAHGQAGDYQSVEAFVAEAFADRAEAPEPAVLWLNRDLKAGLKGILERNVGKLRVRYWRQGSRTAWVLDEIGKEKPITTGVVVEDGQLVDVRVLAFRESRGWEVRFPFFTNQFPGLRLTPELELSHTVDGISGATLSVQALRRQTRAALFLHAHTPAAGPEAIALAQRTP